MEKLITNQQIYLLAVKYGFDYRTLKAILQVESGQHGFSEKTGRIIIQFEPAWFKRLCKHWKEDTGHTVWQSNQVSDQTLEWNAFNDAFAEDPNAAMQSTSIGIGQLMGFHYAELGFKTVGEMWDFAKISESNQFELILRWIKTIPALTKALKEKNWPVVAKYYNGEDYVKFHYDTRLSAAYRLVQDFIS